MLNYKRSGCRFMSAGVEAGHQAASQARARSAAGSCLHEAGVICLQSVTQLGHQGCRTGHCALLDLLVQILGGQPHPDCLQHLARRRLRMHKIS